MISLLALASGAMAATHNVVVGGNGLTFVPYTVSAQVGDKYVISPLYDLVDEY